MSKSSAIASSRSKFLKLVSGYTFQRFKEPISEEMHNWKMIGLFSHPRNNSTWFLHQNEFLRIAVYCSDFLSSEPEVYSHSFDVREPLHSEVESAEGSKLHHAVFQGAEEFRGLHQIRFCLLLEEIIAGTGPRALREATLDYTDSPAFTYFWSRGVGFTKEEGGDCAVLLARLREYLVHGESDLWDDDSAVERLRKYARRIFE